MLDAPLRVGGLFAVFAGVVLVHELGHYYALRRVAGVPRKDLRLFPTRVPGSVHLRDGETWVSPRATARYRRAYERHDPDGDHFERVLVGGDLFQTGVVVPAALAAAAVGYPAVATALVAVSLLTTGVAVVLDLLATAYTGSPSGDYAALWTSSRGLPVVLLVAVATLHLAVLGVV